MRVLAVFLFTVATMPAVAQVAVPMPRERPAQIGSEPSDSLAVPVPRRPPEALSEDRVVPEVPRPRIYRSACPAVLMGLVGAQVLDPIAERACHVRSPLAVTAVLVNGRMVPLSSEAILECGMATALPMWLAALDGYLAAREDTRLATVLVGTSYACRPRNNAAGSDVSEHGFANALDVIGFELADGRTVSLPAGWTDPLSPEGRFLRYAHGAACASFTTTLGPEANALHADHIHVDLGCHGQRCVARLCE